MKARFIFEFRINSKEFKVVSNAGMMAAAANINTAVTNNLLTPKRLMSVMAPSMMSFDIDHPPSIFKIIVVEWTRPKVKIAFKNVSNLLLCLDGINNAFPWADEQYRCKEGQTTDPSYAYGITYYNRHCALARQGNNQTNSHKIAHQTASKKISRLINEGKRWV